MPLLVIQMGHCFRTSGATGTNGEQDFATRVANDCKALLSRNGWSVRTILADDSTSLYRGDAFAAIHADGSTNTSVRGASVGYRTPEGQEFGQAWKRAYAARGWPGGFRADNYTTALAQYYGTGNAVGQGNRRAIIVECGFLTSPEDRAVLNAAGAISGTNRVALAIGDALGITSGTSTPASQGDDVSFNDILTNPVSGFQASANDWITMTSGRAEDLQVRAGRIEAVLGTIAAAVAEGDLDPNAVLARVDTAVREATAQTIDAVVLPALQAVLAEALGQDNKDTADAILAALADKLQAA